MAAEYVCFRLHEIETKDHLIHQGIVSFPDRSTGTALVWVHGLSGKFYGDVPLLNGLSQRCTKRGMAFASFNSRGHDVIASLRKRDPEKASGYTHITIGAGYEVFEESVQDLDAVVSHMVSLGFPKVVLAGHSTGANKVCYYAATQHDTRVAGVILAGPMSDRLGAQRDAPAYEKSLTMVQELVRSGKGNGLVTGIHWMPLTANRAFSLLAPDTAEDVFTYGDTTNPLFVFSSVTCPMLLVLSGNDETADRPVAEIQKTFDACAQSSSYTSVVIPGADHGYSGKTDAFIKIVTDWVASVV